MEAELVRIASNITQLHGRLEELKRNAVIIKGEGENIYILVADEMVEARRRLERSEFAIWVEKNTPYKKATATEYLAIADRVISGRGRIKSIKSIPYKALRALSKINVTKSTQDKVLRLYAKAENNPDKHKPPTVKEVKKIISESLLALPDPESSGENKESTNKILPPFSRRLEIAMRNKDGIVEGPFLFGLHPQCPPEDIQVYTKVWLQKYHPDKQGGDSSKFIIIKEISNRFIKDQNEVKLL